MRKMRTISDVIAVCLATALGIASVSLVFAADAPWSIAAGVIGTSYALFAIERRAISPIVLLTSVAQGFRSRSYGEAGNG